MSKGVSAHVSRYPLCMNKTNDNKKNSQSLKPISPFLQRVQEAHEELMVGKGVRLVTDDTMERGLSQILCKHRNAVQIEQNLFKAEVAQAAAALFSK